MTTSQENHRVFEGLSAIRIRNRFQAFDINSASFCEILAVVRQPGTSWRRNAKTHFDQSNRDIGTGIQKGVRNRFQTFDINSGERQTVSGTVFENLASCSDFVSEF